MIDNLFYEDGISEASRKISAKEGYNLILESG